MFTKLLKHEFKSQASLISILSGVVLMAGLLGGLMLYIFINTTINATPQQGDELRVVLGTVFPMLGLMATIFTIVIYMFAVMLILYYRFYKHHFTDEGYLTFTLPASTHQILLASILNIVIWMAIASVVMLAAISLIILPLSALRDFFGDGLMIEPFWAIFEEVGFGYSVTQVISVLCTAFGSMILAMLSITLGSVVVKKYKLLAGVGIYYGINMVVSFVTGIFSTLAIFSDVLISAESGSFPGLLTMLLPAVLYLGIGIGGYFLMHYLIDEKLNLP